LKWIATIGVMLVLGLLAVVAKTMGDVNGKLDVIAAREPQKVGNAMNMTTTWKSALGTQTLTTPKLADETNAAWAARHKAAVLAMQVEFPIIP